MFTFFQLLKTSFNWEIFSCFTNKKFIFSVISKQKMRYLRFKIQNFDTLANQRMWYIGYQLKNKFRQIWMNHEIESWLWKSDFGSIWPTASHYFHKNTIISSRVGKYVDFWQMIMLLRTHQWRNSITELIIIPSSF